MSGAANIRGGILLTILAMRLHDHACCLAMCCFANDFTFVKKIDMCVVFDDDMQGVVAIIAGGEWLFVSGEGDSKC